MKPWVVGKHCNCHCLKNIRHLSCCYHNKTKAWMTCSLFSLSAIHGFKDGVTEQENHTFCGHLSWPPKGHCFEKHKAGVPANSHLQPLDAGIIKNVKHFYRKCIVRQSHVGMEGGDAASKIAILDAMHFLAASWNSVRAETMQNCF